MTLTNITGTVRFKVEGQKALPRWAQQAITNALDQQDSPPEALRFQCRIATDARENFKEVRLEDGETLRLHPKSNPQFGKNSKGHAYLTATMTYSGDGENYTVRWEGDAVPQKMQDVAVKHDKGLSVRATTVGLDLSRATISPAWKAHRHSKRHVPTSEKNPALARPSQPQKRGKRTCARLTDGDVKAVAA